MQLSELQLNRNLYKTQPQTVETLSADDIAANVPPPPSTAIASGNTVTDVNTNAEQLNGATIAPGTIPPSTLDIANYGWTQTCAFSVTDADTVAWTSGTFTSADGVNNLSIGSGNTGNMVSKTYIYLDINVSTTAYQISTIITDPIGIGKVLIAVCQNGGSSATYILVQATQIIGDNVIANTINAQKLSVSQLSAITADLGSITAGTITGVLFRTATTGKRIEITSSPTNLINFYDASTLYGSLEVTSSGAEGVIQLTSVNGGGLILNTGVGASGFTSFELMAGGSVTGSSNASNAFVNLTAGGADIEVHQGAVNTDITITADTLEFDVGEVTADDGLNADLYFRYRSVTQPITYTGYVSGTSVSNANNSFTVTNPSTGRYTVTHNLGTTSYNVQVSVFNSVTRAITIDGLGSTTFQVRIATLGIPSTGTDPALINSDFMFTLVKLA